MPVKLTGNDLKVFLILGGAIAVQKEDTPQKALVFADVYAQECRLQHKELTESDIADISDAIWSCSSDSVANVTKILWKLTHRKVPNYVY